MEAILDSSFILSCMKRKIDFLDELEIKGFKAVIPREVLQELKDLRLKVGRDEKTAIDVALDIIEKRKVKKMSFGGGKVDEHLIKMGQKGVYIASLDSAVKRAVPNKILISNSGNSLIVERE